LLLVLSVVVVVLFLFRFLMHLLRLFQNLIQMPV
jgi:hypothetical protein